MNLFCLIISVPSTIRGEIPGLPYAELIREIYKFAKASQGTIEANLTHLLSGDDPVWKGVLNAEIVICFSENRLSY